MSDWNTNIINEFRANGGKVGGQFEGAPLLILHSTGAKSGQERLSPVVYRPVADGWAIFASKAGAPTNPDWYHNLRAHPETTIEIGSETIPVTATVVEGAEREAIWAPHKEQWANFAEYETKTTRTIPVIVLTRR